MILTLIIIYAIVTAILYVIGYWLFCRSYNNCRYKDKVSFDEYFDDQGGLFIVPAFFAWPFIVVFFPLILLIGICYILTRKIKEYHNIED